MSHHADVMFAIGRIEGKLEQLGSQQVTIIGNTERNAEKIGELEKLHSSTMQRVAKIESSNNVLRWVFGVFSSALLAIIGWLVSKSP